MLELLRKIWTPAYNLTLEDRRWTVRAATLAGAVLAAGGIILAERIAERVVASESAWWDAVLLARLGLTRLGMALPLTVLAVFLAVLLYQVLENSALGKRLLIWADSDLVTVKAQKTRNAGTLLSTLLASLVLGLLLGVLR